MQCTCPSFARKTKSLSPICLRRYLLFTFATDSSYNMYVPISLSLSLSLSKEYHFSTPTKISMTPLSNCKSAIFIIRKGESLQARITMQQSFILLIIRWVDSFNFLTYFALTFELMLLICWFSVEFGNVWLDPAFRWMFFFGFKMMCVQDMYIWEFGTQKRFRVIHEFLNINRASSMKVS